MIIRESEATIEEEFDDECCEVIEDFNISIDMMLNEPANQKKVVMFCGDDKQKLIQLKELLINSLVIGFSLGVKQAMQDSVYGEENAS